jgi:hypothetical protein
VLDQLGIDQSHGSLGHELKDAILDAMAEAEDLAVRRQGMVILAAIRGDIRFDPGCEPVWFNQVECEAELVAS